jgi:DNA-binding GntR family transcriptional regulator
MGDEMPKNGRAEQVEAPPVDRRSQTLRAYDELRRRILNNEMPAGASYLEQTLADELGMSRTPVREALIRLSDERLVEVKPRHGARILPVSATDMAEIYELLTALEAIAAQRVAERGLNSIQVARLDACVSGMEQALDRNDLITWSTYDRSFHNIIVELAGNKRLSQVVAMFRDQAHRARMQTLLLRPKPTQSNRDHAALVQAIRDRNGAAAFETHRRHRQDAGRMLLKLLSSGRTEGL